MKKYQLNYAEGRPQMYDKKSRVIKARRIVNVLSDYYSQNKLKTLSVLDVGSSTGIIDAQLSKSIGQMVGIDIDKKAVDFAKNKYKGKYYEKA